MPERFSPAQFQEYDAEFSPPDGRWIALSTTRSGHDDVVVRAFPLPATGQAVDVPVSSNGGIEPRWTRTARELLHVEGERLMAVPYEIRNVESSQAGRWFASRSSGAGSGTLRQTDKSRSSPESSRRLLPRARLLQPTTPWCCCRTLTPKSGVGSGRYAALPTTNHQLPFQQHEPQWRYGHGQRMREAV